MRIAFVTDCFWPRVNGVTVSVQSFKDELERRGHEVIVLCPEYPKRDKSVPEPGVLRFDSMGNSFSVEDRLVHLHAFPSVFMALDRFRPDAVHINTEFALQFAARLWCKARGYPFLITAHTNWEHYIGNYMPRLPKPPLKVISRTYMRLLHGTADILITPTSEMAAVLRSYHIRRKIRIIPSGIDPAMFVADPAETASWRARFENVHPALAGKRWLLFVGRVAEEKNVAFLIPSLARVVRKIPDAALVLVGDGPGRDHVERLAARAGLQDRVVVTGYLPRAELRHVYANAEIFAFASKTETLGLATIEAMTAGVPVVAVGIMGTRTVMRGDNGGFMVREDLDEFSAACVRLLSDPALRAAKSAEAREWSKQFSIAAQTDRMERIFEFAASVRRSAMPVRRRIKVKLKWLYRAIEGYIRRLAE
ncbi:MAG: glycosyltransferase [Spirochaetales bacterium]|nr:glycosyltransferase [Spirochaetales bacterium]